MWSGPNDSAGVGSESEMAESETALAIEESKERRVQTLSLDVVASGREW